ncbi:MAG: hypothetical protein JNM66_31125 [Bryobacterales bacterium]|nr:hypothetical protein [Bryobacterales bacterium]
MNLKNKFRLSVAVAALFLFTAPSALADRGGRHGSSGRGYYSGGGRHYSAPQRNFYRGHDRGYYAGPRYVSGPRVVIRGGFTPGRFYSGRGYYYGNRFWARPYFGIGVGIPFGFGYRTARGCGYVDEWGDFYPAPCYLGY